MIPVYPIDCGKDGCDKALEQTSAQATTLMSVVATLLDELSFTLEAQAKLIASVQRSAQNAIKRRLNVQYDRVTEVTDYLNTLLENRLTEQQVMLNYAAPGIGELTEFGTSESTWQATAATGTANQSAAQSVIVQPQTAEQEESSNDYGAGGTDSGESSGQSAGEANQAWQGRAADQGRTDTLQGGEGETPSTANRRTEGSQGQTQAEVTAQPLTPLVQAAGCSPFGPLVPVVVMAQLTHTPESIELVDEQNYDGLIPELDDTFDYPEEE